jgi:hypothetical protein
MAPSSRPPSLPSIPDIALDLDEKTHLLPEFDEVLSSTGESSTTLDDDDDFRPSRSHSTHTQHSYHRQRPPFPTRFPSIASTTHTTYTNTTRPLTPRQFDLTCQVQPLYVSSCHHTTEQH